MLVRKKLRASVPSEPLMSRTFIENIYFQIICGLPKLSMLKMSQLLKAHWAVSRINYHCLVYSPSWYLWISVLRTVIPNICIYGDESFLSAVYSHDKVDRLSLDKHNTDRLTKHCCFQTPSKHTQAPTEHMQLVYSFSPTKTSSSCTENKHSDIKWILMLDVFSYRL